MADLCTGGDGNRDGAGEGGGAHAVPSLPGPHREAAGAAVSWCGQAMSGSAGGRRDRSSAGLSGGMSLQLTASDVIELAINVVQNGQDYRELRPDLAYFLGGLTTKPGGRGQSANRPASDAIRKMLEELYREILRANGLGAARALSESRGEELSESDKQPPS